MHLYQYQREGEYERFKRRFLVKSSVEHLVPTLDTYARLTFPRFFVERRLIFRDYSIDNPCMDGGFGDIRRSHGWGSETLVYRDWFTSFKRAVRIPYEGLYFRAVDSRWVYPPAGYQLRGVGWLP